jgi:hypothetical protein
VKLYLLFPIEALELPWSEQYLNQPKEANQFLNGLPIG